MQKICQTLHVAIRQNRIRIDLDLDLELELDIFNLFVTLTDSYFLFMKKVQNYLTKPEELRKKLQCPSFRHDFVQWSKLQLCNSQNRHITSKSPSDSVKKQQNTSITKNNHNRSKQNIVPNSLTKNNSLSKKLINPNKSFLYPKFKADKNIKKKTQTQSQTHFYSLTNINHNKSLEQSDRYKSNYSSLQKSRQESIVKSKDKKKKLQQASNMKKSTIPDKKLQFKYSYRTRQGVLASNPSKTNQDRLLIKTKIGQQERNLFVVADGHGTFGHLVAQNIVQNFGMLSQKQFPGQSIQTTLPTIYDQLQKSLTQSDVNASCSGSTLVSVVVEDNHITCANVGDSRAILSRQVDKKSWELIYLSQDQKPCVESERKRILKHGGRVQALRDQKGEPIGPLRVWLPNQNIQGLAMSRSLGDNVSKPYGVTHKPQIIKIPIDKRDKFILIASDGVWEFISNQEVLQLIVPFYREGKLEQACDALLKLSLQRWTVQDNSVVDDITFILIFLEQ